ncbi:MAG: ATP-binding cassette domain-containing protein [Acidobacteriota bacterium]
MTTGSGETLGTASRGGPLVEIVGVRKDYGGTAPMRLRSLAVQASDRLVLLGPDAATAETLMHLITGAAVPDEGDVRVAGRDTRTITTDTQWLESLDRFGIVTHRAVLIEKLSVASNLALPITLAIEPMSEDTRRQVEGLADAVRLARPRLDAPASDLSMADRARLHLARALALTPQLLLLEHPTEGIDDAAARVAFGETLKAVSQARNVGFIAFSRHEDFARASGGRRLQWTPDTGELRESGFWKRLLG